LSLSSGEETYRVAWVVENQAFEVLIVTH
jgi:hypothetical protein